jgi:hypothetical protein
MTSTDHPFDALVDLLRVRLGNADTINPGQLQSFKTLMADYADVIADPWYHDMFDELEAQGHLESESSKVMGDAVGRLSADGRRYLRSEPEAEV